MTGDGDKQPNCEVESLSQVDDCDLESVSSEYSDIQDSHDPKVITLVELLQFFEEIKGSKKIMSRCTDFCPDTRLLYKTFRKLYKSDMVNAQQKARIAKISAKLLQLMKAKGLRLKNITKQ